MIKYKGVEIKEMPRLLWFIFNPQKRNGMVYKSHLYVSPKIFRDLKTKKPDLFHYGILEHEITHLKRKERFGKWYNLKFWLFREFRLQEELAADKAMMLYLKKRELNFPIEKRAKKLSSALYLWMISYEEAKCELAKMWQSF